MTDKIVIDGVDVSRCEFFDISEISDGCLLGYREDPVNNYTPNCQDNNCYYKQLKRLKENAPMKLIAKNLKYKSALQKIDDLLHNSEQKYNCIDYETVIAIKNVIIDSLYKNN